MQILSFFLGGRDLGALWELLVLRALLGKEVDRVSLDPRVEEEDLVLW